jgi:hypothetical protein
VPDEANVRIEGYEELMQAFQDFPEIAQGEVEKALEKSLLLLQGAMADYPEQAADTAYRRTGTLGRLWTAATREVYEVSAHIWEGRMGNATPYGPYVQDPERQAPWHAGRWETTDDEVRENEQAIAAILSQAGGNIVAEMAP